VIKIFISWKREDILSGLDPSLDYRRYHSSLLNLEFDYPQASSRWTRRRKTKGLFLSNWYIVTGSKPDGSEYFYGRWYTAKDVVSIEFEYPRERLEIHNKIIEDMTTPKRFRFQ
jgi:hypothetical protein